MEENAGRRPLCLERWALAPENSLVREWTHCRRLRYLLPVGMTHPSTQRRKKRTRRLPGWDDEQWNFRFQEFQAFVAEKGHSRVPARWKPNPSLGRWVAHQRELARQGLIEPDRARKLRKLGLEWSIDVVYNEETERCLKRMLARLDAFRKEHGHSAVPPSHDPALWRWIQAQRRLFAAGLMSPARRRALDAADFPWERLDPRWEEKLVRLREFHRRQGHTLVPYDYLDDPALGSWVYRQRKAFRRGSLAEDRRRRLDEVGPGWKGGE